MYAHQVIEDLERYYNPKEVNALISSIKNAQSFNFGSDPSAFSYFEKKVKYFTGYKGCYKGDYDIGIPYNACWFDFEYEKGWTKYGYLIQKVNDDLSGIEFIEFTIFIKGPKDPIWEVWGRRVYTAYDFNKTWTSSTNISTPHAPGEVDGDHDITLMLFRLCNFFLILLSCKNITTIDNDPPLKLNKKRIKKGKQPLFTYKTLVIKPTGKKQESVAAQGLWDNRVHLCRGHFKEYTAEKPLFGRITGRFWWQPSVRGNKEKGMVVKDYEVKTA